MKYNLTEDTFQTGAKIQFFFCQIGLKYKKIVFKYWKYILNTLKSVSKYIWLVRAITRKSLEQTPH